MYKVLHCQDFLNSKSSQTIIILHGLFGSSKNWYHIAKALQQHVNIITVDIRNHGQSFHARQHTMLSIAIDILILAKQLNLTSFTLIGHSMGGVASMYLAYLCEHLPNKWFERIYLKPKIEQLIIVDISPRQYKYTFEEELKALSIDFSHCPSRKEIVSQMAQYIPNIAVRQFLQTNFQKTETGYKCRLNLDTLAHLLKIKQQDFTKLLSIKHSTKTSFIIGEKTKYVNEDDIQRIKNIFTNHQIHTIPNAGHWLHHTHQQQFLDVVTQLI